MENTVRRVGTFAAILVFGKFQLLVPENQRVFLVRFARGLDEGKVLSSIEEIQNIKMYDAGWEYSFTLENPVESLTEEIKNLEQKGNLESIATQEEFEKKLLEILPEKLPISETETRKSSRLLRMYLEGDQRSKGIPELQEYIVDLIKDNQISDKEKKFLQNFLELKQLYIKRQWFEEIQKNTEHTSYFGYFGK